MKISIIGAGSWGTTLALLLFSNGHKVSIWSHREEDYKNILERRENTIFLPGIRIPEKIDVTMKLDEVIMDSEIIVTAVPSQHLRSVLSNLTQQHISNKIIVNVAKGIEIETLKTMSEVVSELFPEHPKEKFVVISGPSFAEEVSKSIPTAVVAASIDIAYAQIVQKTFMNQYFRVYTSTDVKGVELGGALKNVIAIGAGICDGAGYGDNTKAAIMTRGIVEISRLGLALGSNPKTFSGLSGIGDLIATCMSRHSRNRYVGEQIGKGRKLNEVISEMVMVAEGVPTTKAACKLAELNGVEVPIIQQVYNVLFANKEPHEATLELMLRDPKNELT